MKQVEAKEMAEKIIGQTIVGLVINYDEETVTLELSNNDLEFGGDGISMKCYDLDQVRLN
jgi:hypothetical protein